MTFATSRRPQRPVKRGGRFCDERDRALERSPALPDHLPLDLGLELELLVHARVQPVVELALGARVGARRAGGQLRRQRRRPPRAARSSATTRLIRPHSSACGAGSRSPSIDSSVARAIPMRVGSHSEEPPSGTSPMFTNASRKYALSAARIRSQHSASEQPMPTAGPLTAATTGLGSSRIAGHDRVVALGQLPVDVRAPRRAVVRRRRGPSGRRPRRRRARRR